MIPPAGDPLDLSKLSQWAPELARTFVALSSDIALVIDDGGVIRTVEQSESRPIAPAALSWIGRSWVDTASGDTRVKVEKLLQEASGTGISRRREVSHTLQSGVSVPIAYTAIRLGENGPVLAVGRDLRAIAAIQERFIEAQQDMERGYWSARQADSRYRMLFQVATDAVMVVDPDTLLVLDANLAATTLFAAVGDELVGRHATVGFAHASRGALNELFASTRSSGQNGEIRARLLGSVASASVAATSFRAEDAMRLLVRVRAVDATMADLGDGASPALPASQPGDSAEATVVTDSGGRVLLASPAFLGMIELPSEADARGRPLIDWLGTSERPLSGLISQVRRQGVVRSFATIAKPAHGPMEPVDISAALLTEGDQECIGFTIRRVAGAAAPVGDASHRALDAELQRLATRLGDLPLAGLLAEAAALVERHFVELALMRTGGDLDAAASLLGVRPERLETSTVRQERNHGRADPRAT